MTVRVSITDERIDPAEQAAQRVTEALADLVLQAKLTTNFDRAMAIWRMVHQVERDAVVAMGQVSNRADYLSGYGHGV